MLLTAITCLALFFVGRAVCLWWRLAKFSLVTSCDCGALKLELHRCATVFRSEGDTQDFPQPREFRMLVLRLVGIPIFSRQEVIGLPTELDARLDQVSVTDFDAHFSDSFRIAPRTTVSPARAAQMLRRG
jgi:hypothetical protein